MNSGEAGKPSDILALAAILQTLPKRLPGDVTTPGEILAALGDRSTALVLLIFSIPAIVPTPGVPAGMVFGTALSIIGLQMAAGAGHFRLPDWLARRRLRRRRVEAFVMRIAPWIERLGRRTRSRWMALAMPGAARLVGVVVFGMGILIALPIPFGNAVPGLAVFLIALGLAERDGVAVALGLATSLVALAVAAGLVLGGYWLAETLLGAPSPPS